MYFEVHLHRMRGCNTLTSMDIFVMQIYCNKLLAVILHDWNIYLLNLLCVQVSPQSCSCKYTRHMSHTFSAYFGPNHSTFVVYGGPTEWYWCDLGRQHMF